MDRIYYRFPQKVDFERDYGFNADLRYLVKVMSSINGKSGSVEFETKGPDFRTHPTTVRAKRDLLVEIAEKRMDFVPLTKENLSKILPGLSDKGTIDFRVKVRYSYLDDSFNRFSLMNDVYLVRAVIGEFLKLAVVMEEGQGRTLPEEVANTIETQMQHFKG